MNRRTFLEQLLSSAAGATAWLAAPAAARAVGPSQDVGPIVYVGTYTTDARREGVYRYRMDPRTGDWRALGAADVGPNPSFLALRPDGRVLYAVNEVERYEGAPSGAVGAFRVDPGSGDLTLIDRRASRGGAPCYVSVDRAGRFAMVANYAGGDVALFPLGVDGALGDAARVEQQRGTGPRADRQEKAHAHSIVPDPSGRFALSADLGADRIYVYALDGAAGPLAPAAVPEVAVRSGAGPRHIAFGRSGRVVYVTDELAVAVDAFRFDPATGALAPLQTVSLAEGAGPSAGSTAADLHLAPSGRFLYASVRGDDTLVVFAVDQGTGRLTFVERVSSGGRWPRNFGLDPSGRFLYAANQRSDSVVGFRVDPATGRLTPSGVRVEVPAPVCVRFAG